MKKLTLTILAGALAIGGSAFAQSFADFEGFAVKENTLWGFTSNNTALDTRTAISTNLLSAGQVTPLSNANHLATDVLNNRVLYTNGTGAVNTLFAWDFTTNSEVVVGSLSGIGNSSGGATFWNHAMYLYDDDGSPTNQGIWKITFNLDGTVDAITRPFGNWNAPGGLGDIAVTEDGTLYILGTSSGLWSIDITDETPTPTVTTYTISSGTEPRGDGQLFVDNDGNLVTWDNVSRDRWLQFNFDGTGNYTLSQLGGTWSPKLAAGAYADLSSGGASVIPEPAVALTVLLGALGLAARRRRRAA